MIELFDVINGIFSRSTDQIIKGLYGAGNSLYGNDFFETIFALVIVYVAYLIATRKIQSEALLHQIIWSLTVITLVKLIMYNSYFYNFLIEIMDLPKVAFTELISRFVTRVSTDATIEDMINTISVANDSLITSLFDKGGISNPLPLVYGVILWITSTFLLLVILLMTVFATFLSKVILSLMPFVIVFLMFKKTEYIFFGWFKLYISVSLYAPFCLLFGLVTVNTVRLTVSVSQLLKEDFETNMNYILALVLTQALTAVAVFKIPNIINQIIGSANEGGSMTSGVGTVSAGATIMTTAGKLSGMGVMSKFMQGGAKKGLNKMKENSIKNDLGGLSNKVHH